MSRRTKGSYRQLNLMVSLNNAVYMATLCLDPSNYMRPSTNRLRSAPLQGANTGSSPVGCTICRYGGMVDTRALGARAKSVQVQVLLSAPYAEVLEW